MDRRLPEPLAATLGPVLATEMPPQGSAFAVAIVTTSRGRFVIKWGMTPATRSELADESHVLNALRKQRPFVAAPVGYIPETDTNAYAFTYIEGETMLAALGRADEAEKHALIAQFGAVLRRIHGWMPRLPRPADWLSRIIRREQARMEILRVGAVIRGTHTRFDGQDARRIAGKLRAWGSGITTDIAFGHGDFCLPNVLVHRGTVVGVIDWSRGGFADRRFDLATGLFTLRYNLADSAYLTTFLRAYGYEKPVETLHMFEALHALTCFR